MRASQAVGRRFFARLDESLLHSCYLLLHVNPIIHKVNMDSSQIQYSKFSQPPAYQYQSLASGPPRTSSGLPTSPTAPESVRLSTFGSVPKDTGKTSVDPKTVTTNMTGVEMASGVVIGHALATIIMRPDDRPAPPGYQSMRDEESSRYRGIAPIDVSSHGSCCSGPDCCGPNDSSSNDISSLLCCCCCCCDSGCDLGGCDCNCNC